MAFLRGASRVGIVCLGAVRAALACLGLCLLLSPAWGAEKLRVGVYQNSPKVAFADGKAEGIFVDLLQGVAQQEGWELEFVPGTWAEGLQRLDRGEIDLMPDVARTPEREGRYAFHEEPVLSSWNQVYTRKGSPIRSILDMQGQRVAVLAGSVQERQLDDMARSFSLQVQWVSRPDYDTAFDAVVQGQADAVVTNRFYGVRNAARYGLQDTAIIFSPSQLFFAAPLRSDPAVLKALDRHLRVYKQDSGSLYYRSLRRWAVDEVRTATPSWLAPVGSAAGALLLASVVGLWVLRRQVAARTAQLRQSNDDIQTLATDNARLYEQAQAYAVGLEARVQERTAELAALGAFLQAIIDHIPNPIFYKGPDLRFRGCNAAYEEAFGVRRAAFVGKTVLELDYLPLADRQAYQAEDARVLAEASRVTREATIPFADGRPHQTLYAVSGFRDADGLPLGLVGVIVDITPIREAQAALKAAHDEQEAIFQAVHSGIALLQDRVVRRCNGKLEEMMGYAPGELLGKDTRDLYTSDEAYQRAGAIIESLVGQGATHQREEQMRRKDGSLVWCRIHVRALDPADLSRGLVGVMEDVTAERAAKEAMRQAKEAAEAADRIKSAFLATMSHELRTPLNSIIGFTGIILQGLAGPLTPEQSKQLGMVRDSSRHLLALINDVLDISKIEAGELKVSCEPFDLLRSVRKVLDIVRPLADKKQLQLQAELPEDVGFMASDARRVEQVLLNLLSNAIKFTETGQVALRVSCFDEPAAAGAGALPMVRLDVSDTGMGIREEDMARLFMPFHQIDSALSRKHDGTGLGLAICRRLTELMGGRVEVSSSWGQGSTFSIVLPMQAPAQGDTA
ncbi:MAG: PAS domain-containing protein [Giesbergeria sp.]